MSERQGSWFQEACDGVIDAAEAKEVPRGFDTQVSGSLNQNNSGGPELMGGSGRRQGDDGR